MIKKYSKIIIGIIVFIIVILLLSFLKNYKKIETLNFLKEKQTKITYNKKNNQLLSSENSSISLFNNLDQLLSKFPPSLNEIIEEKYLEIAKNISPDPQKTPNEYQKEIQKINEEFIQKSKSEYEKNNFDGQFLIYLAEKLSRIKPPSTLYKAHLDLIKFYLSIGLAIEELKKTDDGMKKIILNYVISNIINNLIEK